MVNIVTGGGWILTRMAEEVKKAIPGTIVSNVPVGAEVTYFINYALYQPMNGITACYFTHKEDHLLDKWKEAEGADIGVYMAERYKPNMKHVTQIYPTGLSHPTISDKLICGVSGRIYPSGRKGEDRIPYTDWIEWRSLGGEWPNMKHIPWQNDEQAREFYKGLDVFVCASRIEGGPIPVMEAIKCGVPVISTDCGNSELWKNCVTLLKEGNEEYDLWNKLEDMWLAKLDRKRIIDNDWDWFGKEHIRIFEKWTS